MLWFVSRRRMMREVIATGEAYREEIADLQKRLRRSEERFDKLVHVVHVEKAIDGTVSILVRFEPVYLVDGPQVELAERLSRRITMMLLGLHEDWRRHALTGRPIDLREARL